MAKKAVKMKKEKVEENEKSKGMIPYVKGLFERIAVGDEENDQYSQVTSHHSHEPACPSKR